MNNIYLKYDNYTESEFEQFRINLKSYVERLERGEELSGRGEVMEFFKLYNTIIPTIGDNGLETIPDSSCSTCTKRLRNNINNYFLIKPIKIEENDSTNDKQPDERVKRGRKPKA